MKQAVFKKFLEVIKTCESNDPVFWAGYLWLNLTEKQSEKTKKALLNRIDEKGDCKIVKSKNNRDYYIQIPSGLGVLIEENDIKGRKVLI